MRYTVVFTPEAEEQLAELYRYIALSASPARAAHFTNAIVDYCESLEKFPLRGKRRDDARARLQSYLCLLYASFGILSSLLLPTTR